MRGIEWDGIYCDSDTTLLSEEELAAGRAEAEEYLRQHPHQAHAGDDLPDLDQFRARAASPRT